MSKFEGKVALVTGGARGIGERTAIDFTRHGGSVVIGDVNRELGEALAQSIGEAATYFPLDVADPASCAAFVAEGVARYGRVDCLVNSAVKIRSGPLIDLSVQDWDEGLRVGLTGTFLATQAFGRELIKSGRGGAVVNLSSIGGRFPYSGSGAYSSVKGAIIRLTEQFALEWATHGIRVNAVAPAHVETPLLVYLKDPEVKRTRSAVTPLGRVGQPEDISNAILYLLSDDASWVTATTIDIDGGLGKSIMNHLAGRKWD